MRLRRERFRNVDRFGVTDEVRRRFAVGNRSGTGQGVALFERVGLRGQHGAEREEESADDDHRGGRLADAEVLVVVVDFVVVDGACHVSILSG